MLFAQMSDLHILRKGSVYGGLIDPAARVRQAIVWLRSMRPKVAALLITGDLTENGEAAEYEYLRILLETAGDIPVYLLPGNHDDPAALRAAFTDHAYFASGERLFFRVEFDDVQIIGLDTVVLHQSYGLIDAAQLEWLDEMLQSNRRPTLLAMHHPPMATHLGMMDRWHLREPERLSDRLRRHDHVRLITCGHLHRAVAARFAGVRLNICPSTTFSMGLDLYQEDRLSWCDEGGAFQIHDWSGGDFLTWTVPCQTARPHVFLNPLSATSQNPSAEKSQGQSR